MELLTFFCLAATAVLVRAAVPLPSKFFDDGSPPQFVAQSPRKVWFQVNNGEASNVKPLELICDATGLPHVEYSWQKNGKPVVIPSGSRGPIRWLREGQSGSIAIMDPQHADIGVYQCHATNIFGTAVSDSFEVQLGVLDHFIPYPVKNITVKEWNNLTLPCQVPYGNPEPSATWVIRNERLAFVLETINKKHITVDGNGSLQFAYVEEFDGRENILYECHATSPLLRDETRAGNKYRLFIEPRKERLIQPKLLWGSPKEMKLMAGETLRLTCIFSARPLPQIHWQKQGRAITSSRVWYDDFGKTLVINSVLPSDEGVYTCLIREGEKELFRDMYLIITAAPHWKVAPPANLVRKQLDTAEMHCDAAAEPSAYIQWLKNGKRLPQDERISLKNRERTLEIRNLERDKDTGVYQCNVTNRYGYLFANAYLHVLAHPPRFNTSYLEQVYAIRQETVILDCSVFAAPDPVVTWLNSQGVPIIFDDRKLWFGNSLEINLVNFSDTGMYKCQARNMFGTRDVLRNLTVFRPTKMIKSISDDFKGENEIFVTAHERRVFQCQADPDPRLINNLTYYWTIDDVHLCSTEFPKNVQSQDPFDEQLECMVDDAMEVHWNTLTMHAARSRHTGHVKCWASTGVDELFSEIWLNVKDVPNPPMNVSMECDDEDYQAVVRWERTFDNFSPITQYIVQYETNHSPGKWKQAGKPETLTNRDYFAMIVPLSPWVDYTFRVLAVNAYGEGPPKIAPDFCRTKPAPPHDNPANVVVQGTEPDNLVIFWKPMAMEDWNGEGFLYNISYRRTDVLPTPAWERRLVEDQHASQTIVRQRLPFKPYEVMVLAQNRLGLSLKQPVIHHGWSGEDRPKGSPKLHQTVQKIDSTSARLTWESYPPQLIMGHFKGYYFEIHECPPPAHPSPEANRLVPCCKGGTKLKEASFPPNATSGILHGLKAMHFYSALMFAKNSKYYSDPSARVCFRMPEGVPSEVTELEVVPVGASTILTTWKPPLQPNGIIRGYVVNYTRISTSLRSKRSAEHETAYVPARDTHHLFIEGRPSSLYRVSVGAETGGSYVGEGEKGPAVEKSVTTWPLRTPDPPDMNIVPIDPYTIKVIWLPEEGRMSGVEFYANYTVSKSNAWQRSREFVRLPQRTLIVTGLSPLQQYQIYGVVRDITNKSVLTTRSEMRIFTTADAKESYTSYPAGAASPLTSSSWFIGIVIGLALMLAALFVVCLCTRSRGAKYPVKEKEVERGHSLDDEEDKAFMEYQYGDSNSSGKDPAD